MTDPLDSAVAEAQALEAAGFRAGVRHVCADITRCDCGWYTHGRPPVRARRYRHHLQRVGAA